MAIAPFGWENSPSTVTPITAENLEQDRAETGDYVDDLIAGLSKASPIEGAGSATTSGTPSTSTQLRASNAARLEVGISNEHADPLVAIYLGLGETAVVGAGPRLLPGDPPWINYNFTGAINTISTTASVPVAFWEV